MKQCKKVRSSLLRAPIMVVSFMVMRLVMQVCIINGCYSLKKFLAEAERNGLSGLCKMGDVIWE